MKKISVIGAGSWGTAIANLLAEQNHQVRLWVYEKELAEIIRTTHENTTYLPGVTLHQNLIVETQFEHIFIDNEVAIFVVPSHIMREIVKQTRQYLRNELIVNAAKGIENIGEAVKNISQALKDRYPAVDWTGPARMRDRTTHGYWKVDYGIIWETATQEIPAFRAQIAQILAVEFGSSNETASRD